MYGRIRWKHGFNWQRVSRRALNERLEMLIVGSPVTQRMLFRGMLWALQQRMPSVLYSELRQLQRKLAMPIHHVLALNLDYELAGMACTTAAVPDVRAKQYRMVRALDWDVPTSLARTMKWMRITPEATARIIPGYLGVTCAHNIQGNFGIAFNYCTTEGAPRWLQGLPLSWGIRQAACALSPEAAITALQRWRPITAGYVVVVAPRAAWWLHVTPIGCNLLAYRRYPQPLCVVNEEDEGEEEQETLQRWASSRRNLRTKDIGEPVRNNMTADLVQFLV